ncbi:glycerol-3-phosphate dehydrogenase [Roseibium sediminis]|uniref:glycerol-3-phosphate dehydrogenase n=1 Tax=Roseibium sediminis TaxID=1775174 RepID=UPI00123E0E1A|nr:glycerol-3-phosphate dehydrogenase [Roseibium sediminis]
MQADQSNTPSTGKGGKDSPFDLLVVGGGINGVGVARDAAGRGLSVLLCEKGDLAEGTSSRSGKYIHGGLRYLEYYEFRLVREALIEREVVLNVASHLSKPLRLVLVHSPEQRPRWLIRLGLFLYDHLGGRKRIPGTTPVNIQQEWPVGLIEPSFTKGFAYYDVWIDDARLVILNARDAARRGAEIHTRTKIVAARRDGEMWQADLQDVLSGKVRTIHARAIFNGAGPWVENVLNAVEGSKTSSRVRLVKGSHIIMKKWWKGDNGFVLQAADKRIIFINPYFDDLALVGTTDIPFDGKPEDAAIDGNEVNYLIGILNRYFRKKHKADDVIHAYSGVRPLFDDDADKNASAVTRDYTFELDGVPDKTNYKPPLLSAFGGKLTTYRKLSEHALERLVPFFPHMGKSWTVGAPLPGGDIPDADLESWSREFRHAFPWLPDRLAGHYIITYGTEAATVLANAKSVADLEQHFGANFYEREARWLIQNEWARTSEDILFRRTKHGIFLTDAEKARFEEWLLERRGAA